MPTKAELKTLTILDNNFQSALDHPTWTSFAKNAKKVGILEDVRFLFFGPGVELLDLENPDTREIRDLMEELHQLGITVSACVSNLRHFGLMDQTRKHNVFAEPASVLISELVKDGYQVITF